MKKLFTLIMAGLLTAAMIATLSVAAMAEDTEFEYARFTATDIDPNGHYYPEFKLDRTVTKWAAIKYRTITETDSTGSPITGQLYAKAAEPHCKIEWNHSQEWETIILDLTTTFDGSTEIWTTTTDTAFRFDMMESNRDIADAKIVAGSQIDIAYIAFYNSEADAKAGANAVEIIDAKELATEGTDIVNYEAELLTETIAAEVVEEVVEEPTAPQTFDAGIIAAVAAIVSAAGYALSKKR